ncbi:M-phase phosphoprotein 6-like protein [Dinothrombium tinctorium]|uniref:M-phase phosphoprotein 6-like protein n=1 Tax=Dinothrombium tinctorium TaxID=1965070 RepID=A0A3S3PGH3_9ACAR|nr:M-phase phosphoprotein 6-like protein [Dinothrombium tinctorium]RWS14764.1 M-phase phosphoprotein 6-like protein [Dinothrombium tinctorium]RWS14868.1 M-phase phosphoprotein 6-like protein [Dinothrombium tinctorium]
MKLSKNLMQMKFMQRGKQRLESEEESESNSNVPAIDVKTDDKFMFADSFTFCENLKFGRMSFKGMNADIEKLMADLETEADREREVTDVSREEMAKRMSSIERGEDGSRPKKRTKYIRPVDE